MLMQFTHNNATKSIQSFRKLNKIFSIRSGTYVIYAYELQTIVSQKCFEAKVATSWQVLTKIKWQKLIQIVAFWHQVSRSRKIYMFKHLNLSWRQLGSVEL